MNEPQTREDIGVAYVFGAVENEAFSCNDSNNSFYLFKCSRWAIKIISNNKGGKHCVFEKWGTLCTLIF